LPKLYYRHGGLVKKHGKKNQRKGPSQNGWVQNDLPRMALWSSWTWG